ncbi:flagellar hook-basal body complex protein [Clostridium ihumii]|uniref:flagellar hook-basal body complex protein n=1 Tax=Clostridium ihumii TaxID=1470356 RepID=UPI00058F6884|nr:flagellar hook-basal body complex protein [Clostridium ihumii]
MIKSMYSGISGMNAQQKKLDVIGNNIANSGTTAFKSSSVTFQDTMRETIGKGSGPVLALGGSNPKQIGMGVQLQSINVNTGQGSLNPTGRPLDNAIDGNGYFIVGKGSITDTIKFSDQGVIGAADDAADDGAMEVYYTRDGEFKRDSTGNLVTPDGYRVMGYAIDGSITHKDGTTTVIKVPVVDDDGKAADLKAGDELIPLVIPETIGDPGVRLVGYTIEKDGLIKATLEDNSVVAIGQIAMASFVNDSGLQSVGGNKVSPSANSGEPILRPGKGNDTRPGAEKAYGDIINGMLEMSNVDLAVEFTEMIVASRSFQACSKVITTGDEILQELVNLKR